MYYDLDADNERKFWITVIKTIATCIILCVFIICLYYYFHTKQMIEAGYTYTRIPEKTLYTSTWVKGEQIK